MSNNNLEDHKCEDKDPNVRIFYEKDINSWNMLDEHTKYRDIKACIFCGSKLPYKKRTRIFVYGHDDQLLMKSD